jgi:hypothetical protein
MLYDVESSPEIPLDQITDDDLMKSHFRMLEPDPELRWGMAFEDDSTIMRSSLRLAQNRVIRRFDDRRQTLFCFFGSPPFVTRNQ